MDVLPSDTPGLSCSGSVVNRCMAAGIFVGGSFGLMIQRMTPALTLSFSSVLLPAGAPSWCTNEAKERRAYHIVLREPNSLCARRPC